MCEKEKLIYDYTEGLKDWLLDDTSLIDRIDAWFVENGLKLGVNEYGCEENNITKEDIEKVLNEIYNWFEKLQKEVK